MKGNKEYIEVQGAKLTEECLEYIKLNQQNESFGFREQLDKINTYLNKHLTAHLYLETEEEKKEVMDVIYGLIFLRDDINKFIL